MCGNGNSQPKPTIHEVVKIIMDDAFTITGQIVDVIEGDIFPGRITLEDGLIVSVTHLKNAPERLICPGFIDAHIHKVAEIEEELNQAAKAIGTGLASPFTMLSFLLLLVIPKLKLSDKRLFDVEKFQFTTSFAH